MNENEGLGGVGSWVQAVKCAGRLSLNQTATGVSRIKKKRKRKRLKGYVSVFI